MSALRTFLPAALLALSTAACAFDGSGAPLGGDATLDERLAARTYLDLAPTSAVGVHASDAEGNPLPYVEPSVVGGRAVLRTTVDGWLLVEDLEIELDDVVIPAGELSDEPIELTDVELRLGTQIDVQPVWSDDGAALWGEGTADLLLDWAMVLDDADPWPLATQRLGEAEFTVRVARDEDGVITAQVHTAMTGEVHRINGLVTFSDLSVSVDAASAAAIVE